MEPGSVRLRAGGFVPRTPDLPVLLRRGAVQAADPGRTTVVRTAPTRRRDSIGFHRGLSVG
ncbi:hypothetical protein FOHLNKBM_4932 [Methylobacterium longum]|nr:hypothetical protein FOHLNKBM_4932 [Methylobacterium longum]